MTRFSDQLRSHQKSVNSQLSIADPASPMAQVMGKLATLDKTVDSLKAEIATARAVRTPPKPAPPCTVSTTRTRC